MIVYCKKCVYHNYHPFNLFIGEDGICSGCKVHNEKDKLDWKSREEKLFKIIKPYSESKRGIHNCVVPISGGKDSYFILDYVKNTLKLHPLVVSHNIHYNTLTGHANIANIQSKIGLDYISQTTNPETVKKITKVTLKKFGSIYWHCISGQTALPVQIASKFKIPLIIWGAHQGVDQVGMFSHLDEVEMTRKYRKEHDLMNYEAEDLIGIGGLKRSDLEHFIYPNDKEIEAIGIRGIYLNNYLRWDSKIQHEKMIDKYDYKTKKQKRTFDKYNDVNSIHYSGLHDYIKFIKYGYSKISDHCSREIRLKRLKRSDAIKLIKKYNKVCIQDIDLFSKWINISKKELLFTIDKFRNKNFWYKKKNEWLNKNLIFQIENDKKDSKRIFNVPIFLDNQIKEKNRNEYDLVNRGWIIK